MASTTNKCYQVSFKVQMRGKEEHSNIFSPGDTYIAPPPAGPAALNSDMADMDMPFVALLCFWLVNLNQRHLSNVELLS